jgi:hypothetical protein
VHQDRCALRRHFEPRAAEIRDVAADWGYPDRRIV